jgi:hypothetical protein
MMTAHAPAARAVTPTDAQGSGRAEWTMTVPFPGFPAGRPQRCADPAGSALDKRVIIIDDLFQE